MKLTHVIITHVLVAIAVIILMLQCQPDQPAKPIPTSDTIIKEARSRQAAIDSTKAATEIQHDTVKVWRTRWLAAKDVTVPVVCDSAYKAVIAVADSVIKHDSLLINGLTTIVHKQDTLIGKLWRVHSIDSAAIVLWSDSCGKLTKRLRWQRIKTKVAFGAGVVVGWMGRAVSQ